MMFDTPSIAVRLSLLTVLLSGLLPTRGVITMLLLGVSIGCEPTIPGPPKPSMAEQLYGTGPEVEVGVEGSDYRWSFVLPGQDGQLKTEDDVPLQDDLWIPPGRSIRLHFGSLDYVYTFLQTDLNINEMAIPDIQTAAAFDSPAEGQFSITTSPLCGFMFAHADYRPTIRIGVPQELPQK